MFFFKTEDTELSLCLTKHHAMKTYRVMEVKFHTFLNVVLDGGEGSASNPSHFMPREIAPDIQ